MPISELGQIEQMSNALAISQLKLGMVMPILSDRHIADWLAHPGVPRMKYPDVARLVAEWVSRGDWESVDSLAAQAWEQTEGIHDYRPFERA